MNIPMQSPLGDLEITRVYEEYDGPRLFACRNKAEAQFIAAWVDGEPDTWMYAAISEKRLRQVESGHIDLRSAFQNPEDRAVLIFEVAGDGELKLSRVVVGNELPEDYLPEPGTFVELGPNPRKASA